ncbi:MAG TPA: DUF1080 domain-containing protein [Bacteroidales bacterium]|nr:DUF1080 domain-containing protein [Bacteroidales bacterium]
MRKLTGSIVALIMVTCVTVTGQPDIKDNSLTKKEKNEGWTLLFDGKTTDQWTSAGQKYVPADHWTVENGSLVIKPGSNGGDIVTKEKFVNFELSVDFMYAPGANSGIKYFIDTERDGGKMATIGCEYQVLDNKLHPDAKEGIAGNRTLSSLYDLIPAKNIKDNGPDKWNNARIVVNGNKVQHWLNGQLTVEYEKGSKEWNEHYATSKFKNTNGFADVKETRILLQDHGDRVAYKNIKIREIK